MCTLESSGLIAIFIKLNHRNSLLKYTVINFICIEITRRRITKTDSIFKQMQVIFHINILCILEVNFFIISSRGYHLQNYQKYSTLFGIYSGISL